MSVLAPNLLSLLILLIFVNSRWRRTGSWLEPGIVFAANLIVLYPVRAILINVLGDEAQLPYPGIADPGNLEIASWLGVLGSGSFVVGYAAVIRKRPLLLLKGVGRRVDRDDVIVCAAFFIASLIGIAYQIATGDYMSFLISENRIQGLTQVGTLLTQLQWPAFIGAWILWFRGLRTSAFLGLFASIQLVVIPYQFLQGSKTFLSLLLVSVLLAFYWTRGKFPKTAALGTAIVVILFIFPFVLRFRTFVNNEYGAIPSLQVLDLRSLAANDGQNAAPVGLDALLAVSGRYSGVDELYNMTVMVPAQLPHRYGAEYAGVLFNFVPRALWPGKPIISAGATYGASLGTITSVTPFPLGEAYWDAGLFGVFIGMFVWGCCLAGLVLVYSKLHDKPTLPFFVATFFLSQIYWIAGGESSMAGTISTLPQQAVILFGLYHGLRASGHLKRESANGPRPSIPHTQAMGSRLSSWRHSVS
jgi:hypothetical protein